MEVSFIHLQQSNLSHKRKLLIVNQNFQEPKTSYVLTIDYVICSSLEDEVVHL
jgi:hypothetical protein